MNRKRSVSAFPALLLVLASGLGPAVAAPPGEGTGDRIDPPSPPTWTPDTRPAGLHRRAAEPGVDRRVHQYRARDTHLESRAARHDPGAAGARPRPRRVRAAPARAAGHPVLGQPLQHRLPRELRFLLLLP